MVRVALGCALAVASIILALLYFHSGHLDSRFVALVAALWLFWGVFHDVLGLLVQPLAALFSGEMTGAQDPGPPLLIDIKRETEMLERLVADPPPVPHREILAGIRLAEIYRTHEHDPGKAAALLARLRAKYPDARELQHGDGAT